MHRIKRIASICLWLAAAACLVTAGCGKREEGEKVTFAVGGAPAELDFWQVLVDEFQKSSGIEVELLRGPTETNLRRQGLVTSLESVSKDPDVFLMDVAWLSQFAASGWLEELPSQIDAKAFFGKVVELADIYEGKLIGLPVYVDGGLLYYRKDLLEKYGFDNPPRSWDELVRYCLVIQRGEREANPKFYGFVWQGAQYEGLICNWLEYAGSNNGGIVLAGRKMTLNTPANVEATRLMYDLIHTFTVSPPSTYTEMKEEEVRSYFQQGNALFERNWPYAWGLHEGEDSSVKGRVGIAALPKFEGGQSVSTLGGWHIGISKHSDAKSKSMEFVKFVLSFETQKRLALELGWNPGRKDVYTDEEVIAHLPHFEYLRGIFDDLRPRPNVPYYTLISDVLQRHINSVLAGKTEAAQALAKAEAEAEVIIDRYGQ